MLKKKLKKGREHFKNLSQTAHKPYVLIFFELVYWMSVLKGRFSYYMDYRLFLKKRRISDYVSTLEFRRIEQRLNSPEYYPILEDKYFFYKVLEGNGLRSPKNLYLIDSAGIYNLESRKYIDEGEFLQRELDGFCKIVNGYGGGMIYRMEVAEGKLLLNREQKNLGDFRKDIGDEKYLVQERIIQHPVMNELNPSCVNTIRMLSIRKGQTIHLFQDYLRIGINNSYVDNGMHGNIMIGIREGGRLMDNAYTSGLDAPSNTLERHPQTNVCFNDFTIPYYQESVSMVKSLHELYQQFYMIGWDIGITPDGPIVIEGNNITNLYSYQVLYGGMGSAFREFADSPG